MRNAVGPSPAASPVLSTFAAVTPAKLSAPSTAIVGLDAEFSWTAPASTGGKPITGYKVYIRGKTGAYHLETDHCSVSTTSCSVSLLTLQGSPYLLEQGVRIQATVSAVNAIGESVASSVNSGGAFLETVPSAPPVAPSRNVLTGQTSITVDFLPLAGTSSGGAPVQSYELLWDEGVNHAATDLAVINNGATVSLVGGPSGSGGIEGDSLLTSFKIEDPADPTYVVSGRLYRFRYRAKNRQGWGAPSSTTTIMAAAVPGQLSPAATEMNDALVKVSWVLPDPPGYSSGGQAVTGFEV